MLVLREYDNEKYTGRIAKVHVTYVLEGFPGLQDGYCIMGIERYSEFGMMFPDAAQQR